MVDKSIVGICRFSFLGLGDWVVYRESRKTGNIAPELLEKVRRELYDANRLDLRFWLFETLLLPSLKSQTDKDFYFIVLTSPEMPKRYLDRLKRLERATPMMEVIVSSARTCKEALVPELNRIRDEVGSFPVQFRVDDDDCLANNYIESLREASCILKNQRAYAVSMPKSIVMTAYSGQPTRFYRWFSQFHSAGCAYYTEKEGNTIFAHSHVNFPTIVPSLTLPYITSAFITKYDGHDADGFFLHNSKNDLEEINIGEVKEISRIRFPFIDDIDALARA